MLTNEQKAKRLKEIARDLEGMDSGNADSPILRAGAEALLELDEINAKAEKQAGHEIGLWPMGAKVMAGQCAAAQREVERLMGALERIAARDQYISEIPESGDLCISCGQFELSHRPECQYWIARQTLDSVTHTPDPRDARIAELEAALRGVWRLREMTERTYEDSYRSMFKSRGEAEWDAVEAALKEAK